MALSEHTPEQLLAMARELEDAAQRLREVSETMVGDGPPQLWLHGQKIQRYLDSVSEWAISAQAECAKQRKAYEAGYNKHELLQKRRGQPRHETAE